ncbi:MAG: hypothetical protein QM820_23545 [Minicystis sp.]
MMDHLLPRAGWTRDGTALGYCVRLAVNLICRLERPGGAREETYDDGEIDAQEKRFQGRLARYGFLGEAPGTWAYAGELELTWRTRGGCEKEPPVAELVEVGARVPGEPGSYPIKLEMRHRDGLCYSSSHPEIIVVSPDGQHVGAIGHSFAGEWTNDYPMGIAPVAQIAEGAFNNAGLAHHKRGDYVRAAELFQKAARADVTSKTAAYNLACALARLGDARAQAALADAIARGGEGAKRNARGDADFDGVRSAPWFTALVR